MRITTVGVMLAIQAKHRQYVKEDFDDSLKACDWLWPD